MPQREDRSCATSKRGDCVAGDSVSSDDPLRGEKNASTSADNCEPPSDLEQQSHAASVSAHVHSEPNHAPAEVYLPQHGGKKGNG